MGTMHRIACLLLLVQLSSCAASETSQLTQAQHHQHRVDDQFPALPTGDELRKMTMQYMPDGKGGYLVGVVTPGSRVYYRWRNVVLPRDLVLPPRALSDPGVLLPGDVDLVLSIDPPLDYMITADGLAEPGYYDRAFHRFYRWAGVRFDPANVPAEWLGVQRDPQRDAISFDIHDIEVPAHRREFAEELNATVPSPP